MSATCPLRRTPGCRRVWFVTKARNGKIRFQGVQQRADASGTQQRAQPSAPGGPLSRRSHVYASSARLVLPLILTFMFFQA